MNWTAPKVTRADVATVGDERALLEGMLGHHRQTLLMKCAGLTADRLKARSVEPSGMSLLGLVRHMAEVERSWFRRRVAGERLDFLYCVLETDPDGDFDGIDSADAQEDLATLVRESELARAAVAGRSLETTFFHTHMEQDINLRWVYLHVIEEYARHNGHADLLRERIDGATGA